MAGLHAMDIAFGLFIAAMIAFVAFCMVAGTRRWRQAMKASDQGVDLAREAVADRKKILAALEDIRALLREQREAGR